MRDRGQEKERITNVKLGLHMVFFPPSGIKKFPAELNNGPTYTKTYPFLMATSTCTEQKWNQFMNK